MSETSQLMDIMAPMSIFFMLSVVFIVWLINRHRERMTLIEKGSSSEEIKALYSKKQFNINLNVLSSLKWGILFILGGSGIMIGVFLHDRYYVDEGVIWGMVCLLVGIGLVIFYSIASKKEEHH